MNFMNLQVIPKQGSGGFILPVILRYRLALICILSAIAFVVMMMIRFEIAAEIHDVDAVGQENQTWTIAQVETDMIRYVDALDQAMHGSDPERFEEVFTWFDVLSGRVDALGNILKTRTPDLANSTEWQRLAGPIGILARHQRLIDPLYDSGERYADEDLQAFLKALPGMTMEARDLAGDLRGVIVRAFVTTTDDVSKIRTDLARTLSLFTVSLFITLALMAALITSIARQARERQRQFEKTEQEARNFMAMLDSSIDAVLIANAEGALLWGNAASKTVFGFDRNTTEPHCLSDYLPTREGTERQASLPTQGCQRVRLLARRSDGETFPVDVSVSKWSDGSRDDFMVYFLRDISEQVRFEEEISNARNAAMKGEEAKARFLAVMSHEMRTPLNGLLAAADLMSRKVTLSGDAARFTSIMRSCAYQTLDHINNVLELTRLEDQNGAHYARTNLPLLSVLRAIVVQFEADAEQRGIQINFKAEEEMDVHIEVATALLRRVIGNLLSNAVKFTDEGHIDVVVKVLPIEDTETWQIRISVCDTGIGISEANLSRIFETFETLDASYARVQEGSGLGLGIAKLAAEAMGGHIELKSHPGNGSNFTLVFPAKLSTCRTQSSPSPALRERRKLRILIAEDNKTSRELLYEVLHYSGHLVEVAEDGVEAVAKANLEPFDVILMDIAMPRLDGLMATRLIREQGPNQSTPVIGLTAQADAGILDMRLSSGFHTVLVKPASLDQIEDALAGLDDGEYEEDCDTEDVELVNLDNFMAKLRMVGWERIRELSAGCLSEALSGVSEIDDLSPDLLFDQTRIIAHREAGGAASLGFLELQREWLGMEWAAKAEDAPRILEGIVRIREIITETRILIEALFREESLKTA